MRRLLNGVDAMKLLGLPDCCISANIRIRPGKAVTITTMSYFPESDNCGVALVARSYALLELPDKDKKG